MVQICGEEAGRIIFFLRQYAALLRATTLQPDGYRADVLEGLAQALEDRL